MRWKICVVNRLYPKHKSLISTIDTGSAQTSVETNTPTADENEVRITSAAADTLSEDDHDELEALIDTVTATYELDCDREHQDNVYTYTLRKP